MLRVVQGTDLAPTVAMGARDRRTSCESASVTMAAIRPARRALRGSRRPDAATRRQPTGSSAAADEELQDVAGQERPEAEGSASGSERLAASASQVTPQA